MRSILDDHISSAVFADDVGDLVRHLQTGVTHLLLRLLQVFGKFVIEAVQRLHPVLPALFHKVQVSFHLCGEIDVDDAAEFIFHQAVGHLAQRGGCKALARPLDISALDNGGQRRRIGAWTSDSVFLQRLDDGSLGVTCRRRGEVLVCLEIAAFERLTLQQLGQRRTGSILSSLVLSARPHRPNRHRQTPYQGMHSL